MTQKIDVATPDPAEASRYGSRKWILALLVVGLATCLLWAGRIESAQWVDCIVWVVGLYAGGNVGASLAAVWGRRP